TTLAVILAQTAWAQTDLPQSRIVSVYLDPENATVLHLKTGYVSSVRLPEPVNAVVLGDPGAFKAEHAESEPQLVFFRPNGSTPATTNALITTRTGRTISVSLISDGNSGHGTPVDYLLEYQRPRSFLITATHPAFVIGETKSLTQEDPPATKPE